MLSNTLATTSLLALALASTSAPTQQNPAQEPPAQDAARDDARRADTGPPPRIARATDVIGRPVENADGRIAAVEDVYLHPDGRILYYVVQSDADRFRWFAVPPLCLTPDTGDERFVTDVTARRLAEFETFDPGERRWPAQASAEWCERVTPDALPRRPETTRPVPGSTLSVQPGTAWSLRGMRGLEITNPEGERLGRLADLGLDLNGVRIGFWILSTDRGADRIAVPWEALSFFRRTDLDEVDDDEAAFRLVLDAEPSELERAPEFDADDEDAWRRASQPGWLERSYSRFGVPFALYHRHAAAQAMPAAVTGRPARARR